MPLRDLDYQSHVLSRLDDYLSELSAHKRKADKIAAANAEETDPDLIRPVPDFPLKTWEAMQATGKLPASRSGIPYSSRDDGIGRAVPNIVFKVPTGGGKTYLAVVALSRIFGRYLGRHKGFVLWIVPNEAIYAQTRRQLADRQHPYRQMLDVLSGNAVRLLEKDDQLDAREVESHLCVMLLMLQASNRENKDTLKMFRDRGDVRGFFPPEGDQEAHAVALQQTPNLDIYDLAGSAYPWPMVKDSLGNALRLIRPIVIMDEGHKAVSELAFATLYGFNPCFVLELTATPKDVAATAGRNPRPARYSNILVEVKGIDLDREGMIKMPLNLDPREGSDWRHTLAAARQRIKQLDAVARQFQADSGRYIRPILLVQVERTGDDQRDGSHVHALDAKEWLTTVGGLDEAEIAIKTAATNDLAAPENLDLLAPTNRVQVIITKSALQEGWDCPFAYVLCALAANSNLSAMTQLVGRILRQPQAEKTGVPLLDECYVITHHANTSEVVDAIKKGLEEDGMGDLVKEIRIGDNAKGPGARPVQRREKFARTEIFLPLLLRVADGQTRRLDYEEDILFALDWQGLDVAPLVRLIPDNMTSAERQMRRIRLADSGDERIVSEVAGATFETLVFDPVYAVRMVSDIVPNAWWSREIVGQLVSGLKAKGFTDSKLGEISGLIVETLRDWLDKQRAAKAEALFRAEVAAGRIQFRLRTDGRNWRMPFEAETFEPEGAGQLSGKDGEALRKSLFSPIFNGDFSSQDEREIAVYLDGDSALKWWHRNVARSHYAVQGWRREKIYPDFIFAVQHDATDSKLVVLEMKGQHLAGNPDTIYKQSVLQLMSDAFAVGQAPSVGELELVVEDGTRIECDLVLMTEWKTRLPAFMNVAKP
ncbi:MAG: DEAD/DEAH box helicase family protein [Sulfurimicrobium sp.]|nr:DEAD/DEAH box helicase family protein [Sulfurimicrobium sp.]